MPRRSVRGSSPSHTSGTSLDVQVDGRLTGGYTDEAVQQYGAEAGESQQHNPDEWGANASAAPFIEVLEKTPDVSDALIGHGSRAMLAVIEVGYRKAEQQALTALHLAEAALTALSDAIVGLRELEREICDSGHHAPSLATFVKFMGVLVALVIGEVLLNSVAFEIFGLSDRPLISGVELLNPLYLSSIALTLAIVIGAHSVGRTLQELRLLDKRKEPLLQFRFEYVELVVAVGFTAASVYGLSAVRTAFLQASNAPDVGLAFLFTQIGIAGAAALASMHYSQPRLFEWLKATNKVRSTSKVLNGTRRRYGAAVAAANAFVPEQTRVESQTIHHARAARAASMAQIGLYKFRVFQSTAEPAQSEFFPARNQTSSSGERDKTYFDAGTPFAELKLLTTDSFDEKVAEVRDGLKRTIPEQEAVEHTPDPTPTPGAPESPWDEELVKLTETTEDDTPKDRS